MIPRPILIRPVLLGALLGLALFVPACRKKAPPPPPPAPSPSPTPTRDPQRSVVKVFSTEQGADFAEPWKPAGVQNQEACGVILPGGRVLTTARMVDQANYIEVQKFGETVRYVAKPAFLACDLDLAVLTVEDKAFMAGVEPAVLGDMPQPGDKIVLQGGDMLSRKEDTISGLDMVWSYEAATGVPALVTKGDIDKGILGCPAFKDGRLVGIPFSSWHKDEKEGTLVPVSLISGFLKDLDQGKAYPGLSDLGVFTQALKSGDLADFYELPAGKTGVVITRVLHGGASEGTLREGDIIGAVDGYPVDDEGYTQLDKLGRVSVDYVISLKQPGEALKVDLFRDGQPLSLGVTLRTEPELVPWQPANRKPTYFMTAGFVFVPLTYNYLLLDWKDMKPELKEYFNHGLPEPGRQEIVVMSHVLPADINQGYQYFNNIVVQKVNGRPIGSMRDLVEAFAHPKGGEQVIEFDDHAWSGSMIVFDAKKAPRATKDLMEQQGIPSDRSDDLKADLEGAPATPVPPKP